MNADELGTDGSFNAQVALGPDAVGIRDGEASRVLGNVNASQLANGYIT
ncbi:Biofilm associated protein, partial [Acinetobacter baumannii]